MTTLDKYRNVFDVVYGGVPEGRPERDSDILRAIADWCDRIDDATDAAMEGRHFVDRGSGSYQFDLRRIADQIDVQSDRSQEGHR